MSKIKFVREYNFYGSDLLDVVYKSGRLRTYIVRDGVPQTVKDFMNNATSKTEQYDKVFKWDEVIYQ